MVDIRQFNNLPLLTAKPGLDSALDAVSSALDAFFTEGHSGIAHLEQALADLHRIGGVLTILSLDGAAVFCRELETVLGEMRTQQTPASAMQREVLDGALEALTHFLDALAGGAPNTAMRLFYTYQELHQLRGLESAFEVDLYYPELNVPLPAGVLEPAMDAAVAPAQIKAARAQYQQALLKWLKQDNPQDALRTMRSAVQTVMHNVPADQARAFWWVAAGLLECLILDGLPPDLSPRKLLGRIDLQMKSLVDNSHVDEYATLCEMLYLVARSLSVSDSVESIKQTYSLASYLPQEPPLPPGELAEKLDQMRHTLINAQEMLERCVQGDVASRQSLTEIMEQLYVQSEGLDRNTLQFLCKQMYNAVSQHDDPDVVHHIKLELAMAMLLLGSGIEHYLALGNHFHERVRLITQRLVPEATLSQLDEGGMAALVALHCQAEEQEVLIPMAREMKNNMQMFEQTLNVFFGNPAAREELATLPHLLSQVHGGLYMLDLERPARLMASLQRQINHYVAGGKPGSNEMRDVAAAVSALDAYVHDLTQGQKSDSSSMEEIIAALQTDQAGVPEEELQPEPVAPAGVSVREGGEDDELLEVFLEEAQEVLETLHSNLLLCQRNPDDREALVTIRRSFHTLKGSGRMVGLTNLGEVAWALERAMNKWLQEEKSATPEVLEMIGDAGVLFQHWVDKLRSGGSALIDTVALLAEAQRVESGETKPQEAAPRPAVAAPAPVRAAPVAEALPTAVEVPAVAPLELLLEPVAMAKPAALTTPESEPALVLEPEPVSPAFEEAAPAPDEEHAAETQSVQIGELSISPVLFKIATEEASANIDAMKRFAAELHGAETPIVNYDFMRAAHTLAGVNRTMGVKQIGELAFALEQCLQVYLDSTTAVPAEQLALIDEAVAALHEMNHALRNRQEPLPQLALIERLLASKSEIASQIEAAPAAPAISLGDIALSLDNLQIQPEPLREAAAAPLQDLEFNLPIEMPSAAAERAATMATPISLELEATAFELTPDVATTAAAEPIELALPSLDLMESGTAQPSTPEQAAPLVLELPELGELGELAAPATEQPANASHEAAGKPVLEAISLESLYSEPEPAQAAATEPAAKGGEQAAASVEEDLRLLVSYADYQAQLAAAATIDKAQAEPAPAVVESAETVTAPVTEQEPAALELEQLQAQIAEVHAEEEQLRAQQATKQRTVHDDLDDQLLPIFLEEAEELYPQISTEMRSWRELPEDSSEGLKYARQLQRSLHTLKGSARMAGAMRLGELTHRVEDYLEKVIASGKRDAALMDELDNYFDRIASAIDQLKQGGLMAEEAPVAEPAVPLPAAATPPAAAVPQAAVAAEAPAEAVDERAAAAMLRVRSDIVDDLVNEAGEISVARSRIEIELRGVKDGLQELTDSVNHLRKLVREIEIHAEGQMQARVTVAGASAEKFDPLEFDRFTRFQELTRFMNESVHDVQTVQQSLLKNMDETAAAMSAQAHLNRDLQQRLMSIRMLPFSSISQRLYRIVRQTGKELNKKVNLDLRGGEVELDRSVLEKMTAPFEHLLRNSIVHGLEDAAQRQARGKPALGNISLSLHQEGNEVVFEYADDGAGLNLDRLRQKGLENGLLRQGEHASDEQVMRLIFATGLSTATELTEISGRGVGMDVVRSEIEGLGGRIDVHSETGKGVRFVIYLPLTLAVMKTLTVRAVQQNYAIPAAMVEQVQQVKPAMLELLYHEGKVEWQGRSYPLHYLPSLLGDFDHMPEIKPYNAVLLLRSGEQRLALHLDELLGNQEVVVKNIGPQLARLPGIAGATIQGDGKVVLILNPAQLVQQVENVLEPQPAPAVEPVRKVPVVMVVDDSLTVRKITTRLLNRAGYEVITAKDGVDALEQLVEVTPDAMLLDVEMPRMDGFELTKQLRRNAKTLHTPIIMITSRTADKHKNYALELGVDEYLGKPYQEDELLAHIARLIGAHAVA